MGTGHSSTESDGYCTKIQKRIYFGKKSPLMSQYFLTITIEKLTLYKAEIILLMLLLNHLAFSFVIFYAIFTIDISSIVFNWIGVKKKKVTE